MQTITFETQADATAVIGAIRLEHGRDLVLAFDGTQWGVETPDDLADAVAMCEPNSAALATRKTERCAEVNERRDTVFAGGFSRNFGGSAGWRTLDCRHERDRLNWLILKTQVSDLIAGGLGAETISLRDAADETFTASASTIKDALGEMEQWGQAVLAHSWTLKDEIDTAPDMAAIEAVDLEAGWPE